MDQSAQVENATAATGPDRHLRGVEDQIGGHCGGCPPADDAAGEDVEDEGHVDDTSEGGHVGEVGHPQLIRSGRGEIPVDQISRPLVMLGGDRGADLLPAQRSGPPLGSHQPFDRAPSHVVAMCAQVQPHLAGTVPATELVIAGRGDQLDDLGITQRPARGRPGLVVVVGARGDLVAVLSEHGADRLDPKHLTVCVDELD